MLPSSLSELEKFAIAFIKATSGPMSSVLKVKNRSDIDRDAYAQSCLKIMAQAHLALAQNAPTQGVSKELLEELEAYRATLNQSSLTQPQLDDYLVELTSDWTCPSCGEHVAEKLTPSSDETEIVAICKSCGATSALSADNHSRALKLLRAAPSPPQGGRKED